MIAPATGFHVGSSWAVLAEVRGLLRLVGAPEHAVALLGRLRTALTSEQPMIAREVKQ